MATLNRSERAPRNCSAMSRCPVLEMGRNSVMPSTMPRMMVFSVSDTRVLAGVGAGRGRYAKRSKGRSQVLVRKSTQGLLQVAAQRHHFEGFAHFARQQKSASLAGEASVIRSVGGLGGQGFDACAKEKGSLRGEAGDLEFGIECGFADASEVDP